MNLEITLTHSHKERGKDWVYAAKEYLEWRRMREQAEKNEKKFFEELKKLSDGIPSKGEGYVFTPSLRKGSVDYKAIPELKSVDLDKYRTDCVEIWKLTYELIGE